MHARGCFACAPSRGAAGPTASARWRLCWSGAFRNPPEKSRRDDPLRCRLSADSRDVLSNLHRLLRPSEGRLDAALHRVDTQLAAGRRRLMADEARPALLRLT